MQAARRKLRENMPKTWISLHALKKAKKHFQYKKKLSRSIQRQLLHGQALHNLNVAEVNMSTWPHDNRDVV